ncbi:MAG: hypothetical protein EOQ86_28900 [Mesorhizobium sp.]|uniref:hypothetical protein n=1 Tax=Mesorhizobium sp. TaxID=1871066 RepID=UPI000FE94ADB|nr:hypothetical protein [Mesorhizobium sp.]RWH77028.1 MAG: hypothetical protein EOQ86_28900 [Mesorhizobium sp.]RWH85393.1 MAG: hypothetical protein EOQ87_30195 [Mesorhizobium sp.]RWH92591.1 MAG: hypothetical protein EOQ88_29225 [Mesorhizobium sp.]RWH96809.1 MAG: hypothetical protein EOQ89_27820 [Mesorhizobium sp.]RWI13474.1 MAG: hypothetical protein EOQ91_28025 [Mesorhizobium sp.]
MNYLDNGCRPGERADESRLAVSLPNRLRNLIRNEAKRRATSEAAIIREHLDFAFTAKARAAAIELEIQSRD